MNKQDINLLFENPLIIEELKEFKKIKTKLFDLKPFRKGSISKIYQLCGKKNCKCKKDKAYRHGPYYYWTSKKKGKTVTLLLPADFVPIADFFVYNSKLLEAHLKQLAVLSDSIVKKLLVSHKKKNNNSK